MLLTLYPYIIWHFRNYFFPNILLIYSYLNMSHCCRRFPKCCCCWCCCCSCWWRVI